MARVASKVGRPSGVEVDGGVIRRYRERVGLGREDLATLVSTTSRTIQRIENEGLAGLALLKQVCEVLRLPIVAVMRADAESIRANLRAHGLAAGLPSVLVGRDPALAALAARLTPEVARSIVVLEGPVGVGKSSLAQRLAHDLAARYDHGVVWVRGSFTDPVAVQLDIARALGFDAHLPAVGPAANGRDWRQAFTTHLWTGRRLLVIDDVVDERQIAAFVGDDGRASILATTRFKRIADAVGVDAVTVPPLSRQSILELLGSGLEGQRLAADPRGVDGLVELIDGMPGVAHVVRTALRRERLTTPSSWLARFAAGPSGDIVGYYASLATQLSRPAWSLFATLGAFGSEPVPLALAAAAADMDEEAASTAASELLDAHVVSLHQAGTDDGGSWLRLPTHAASAARALLADREAATFVRAASRLAAELAVARAESMPSMVRFYRRHRALLEVVRGALSDGLGPPPDFVPSDDPERLPRLSVEPERVQALVDLAIALGPVIVDRTVADGATWVGLALVAARGLGDALREGVVYHLAGVWQIVTTGYGPRMPFHEAAERILRRDGLEVARLANDMLAGGITIMAASPADARAFGERVASELHRHLPPSRERACLLSHAGRALLVADPERFTTLDAAALCRQGLDELARAGRSDPYAAAVLAANEQAFLRVAAESDVASLCTSVDALRALEPLPWIRVALAAHAACLGGASTPEARREALDIARRELTTITRECAAEVAPRLLWFIASIGLYEVTRRASAGQAPLIRCGLAGHGVPVVGAPAIPEMFGFDLLLMLSTEATGELLTLDYVDLALELADHVVDGRLVSPALRGLRQMLAPTA